MHAKTPNDNSAWHTHLSAQGGQFDAHHRIIFHLPVSETDTALIPLVHLAIIEIEGPDSEKFLQGQTSAQVTQANGHVAPPTAFCTPKGRMIANAQLMRVDTERYWLLLDASVAETLRAHLAKYAVFYKTELRLRQDLAIVGLSGQNTTTALKAYSAVPSHDWTMTLHEEMVVTRHPGEPSRFVMIADVQTMIARWDTVTTVAKLNSNDVWKLLDIRAGLAWVSEAQREAFLPQMLNWEALGGISFKKGCYTGQEVVARAHYRGQVKKRLMRFGSKDIDDMPIGNEAALTDATGKSLGDVVLAAPVQESGIEFLAVVTQKDVMPEFRLNDMPVELLPLPYPLERLDPESFATMQDGVISS
ncbi:CAF17-like 4Fe-4S cluster assembly/insertion protein YgfZ [Phytohalomonas tamaricis]|uniref:CAF17-like 4Fe-4S cluster assembly/insertion protein YgfZ n=1 Tax=Phytohalomonas tamaricis TaxID=2081032 RepID=UPI000D0B6FDB|nr:folate-binding protein YgfZ [Phytohalomonas tamaricis]